MNIFLKLKHWQLFGLLIGILVVVSAVAYQQDQIKILLMTILFAGVYYGWLYALGVNLNKKLPSTVNMNLKKFKCCLLIPIVCMLLVIYFTDIFNLIFPIVMLILSLVSMYCIFYCFYFIAKALKAVESQEPNEDFLGEFFYLWFFPIGIWFIQPRVNKIFDEKLQNKITA